MSLTELALLDGRRPLPLRDVIVLTLTLTDKSLVHPCVCCCSKSLSVYSVHLADAFGRRNYK
jgi:hypothetical protein